jgi:hypothetical protein
MQILCGPRRCLTKRLIDAPVPWGHMRLLRLLKATKVVYKGVNLIRCLPMRTFVVPLRAEELVTPDWHMAGAVCGHIRLTIDDAEDLLCGKATTVSGADSGEVREL